MVRKTLSHYRTLEKNVAQRRNSFCDESRHFRVLGRIAPPLAGLLLFISAGCDSGPAPLTAEIPLHLEDHLDAARIEGSEVPEDIPQAVEWSFDEPQPDWKPAYGYEFSQELVEPVQTGDALRVILEEKHVDSDGEICGYIQ